MESNRTIKFSSAQPSVQSSSTAYGENEALGSAQELCAAHITVHSSGKNPLGSHD